MALIEERMNCAKFSPEQRSWILEVWVPALRSGRYYQAQERLRRGEGYCCLGVACDLKGVDWYREGGNVIESLNARYEGMVGSLALPVSLARELGIMVDGEFAPGWTDEETDGTYDSLATMNDGGMDFDQIADFIEHELMAPDGVHRFMATK